MTPSDANVIETACARLILAYARLNDAGRWEDVAALFTEDGIMARPGAPDVDIVGRSAILASFLARPARASCHFCTNIIVTIESATVASATSLIQLYTGAVPAAGGLPALDLGGPKIGAYDDRFTLTPVGWRFAVRRGRILFT